MGRLKEKCILVTGASRGIGAGIARCLAKQGARVAITYTSRSDAAEEVLTTLSGKDHFSLKLDISAQESVQGAFSEVLERFGRLDGLVNNAGITKDQLLLRMKAEDFDSVIQTNLRGAFLCTKSAIKPMLKNKCGAIVNITSVVGQSGNPGQCNYSASKAGLEAFTKSIALEYAAKGIRLNCVAPGFIETEMTEVLNDSQKEAIFSKVPMKKMGTVDDVAYAVAYLLSDESTYVTGQTISVNGGLYM